MSRDRIARNIAEVLKAHGVPVVRAGWSGSRLGIELTTGGVMVLPTKPTATAAQLDAFMSSAVSAFLSEWQTQQQALEDRLIGTCKRCGESLDAGLVYVQGRTPLCVSCYRAHTATGEASHGDQP